MRLRVNRNEREFQSRKKSNNQTHYIILILIANATWLEGGILFLNDKYQLMHLNFPKNNCLSRKIWDSFSKNRNVVSNEIQTKITQKTLWKCHKKHQSHLFVFAFQFTRLNTTLKYRKWTKHGIAIVSTKKKHQQQKRHHTF